MAFFKGSYYENVPLFEPDDTGKKIFDGLRARPLSKAEPVLEHSVALKERLDSVAHHYYAEPLDWRRIADANPDAQNFYLIVEALDDDGNPVTVTVRNEEDGSLQRVTKWGVRVSQNVFTRVQADKQDDGIIQENRVATKPRGRLEPEYAIPVMGGTITEW